MTSQESPDRPAPSSGSPARLLFEDFTALFRETRDNPQLLATPLLAYLAFLISSGLVILAWAMRFIEDDAFISFRYARNLARGEGLVFNPGERLEGYTNFLWTLIMSLPLRWGVDPVMFTHLLGLSILVLNILLIYRIGCFLIGNRFWSLMLCLAVGTNFTFVSYATSGLETGLHAFLVLWAFDTLMRLSAAAPNSPIRGFAQLSLITALALASRLDACVILAAPMLYAAWLACVSGSGGARVGRLIALTLPCLCVVGAWLLWKLSYYGEILPNGYYAKVTGEIVVPYFYETGLPRVADRDARNLGGGMYYYGAAYLAAFFGSYRLWPIVIVFLLLAPLSVHLVNRARSEAFVVACSIALWLAFVASIGGDFMEFRFLVPVIPLLYSEVLWLWSQFRYPVSFWLMSVTCVWLMHGSVRHANEFKGERFGLESIWSLGKHVEGSGWRKIGSTLRHEFGGSSVSIAAKPIGAIGFYSDLPLIDLHGLTDRHVAREVPPKRDGRLAHQRTAPVEYLRERGVNLVLGEIWRLDRSVDPLEVLRNPSKLENGLYGDGLGFASRRQAMSLSEIEPATMISIPIIERAEQLLVLYLTQHPLIDRRIRERRWRVFRVRMLQEGDRVTPQAEELEADQL